ncbi:MAG: pyridine nucleotide-disulfide oxidoreductase, partial [Chitinophagaceae bacterium]|nr:pyridine nucleotide-disulfide oxidoreductase [Chitinophagaceae bacterium]
CYLTTADQLSYAGNKIEKLETTILSQNQILSEIFSKADFLYEKPLTIAQISFDQKKQVENHVLMVGDASGLITPLCGNGMSMAMHASSLAFQAMQLFLEGSINREQMEKRYSKAWKRQFSKRLAIGRIVQSFFGNPFVTRIFLSTISKMPKLANWLIRQTHGNSFV